MRIVPSMFEPYHRLRLPGCSDLSVIVGGFQLLFRNVG
jgi:hypothetical protein